MRLFGGSYCPIISKEVIYMKSFWKLGYALLGVLAISIVAQGCSGGSEEADVKPNPALDNLPKVPDEAATFDGAPKGK